MSSRITSNGCRTGSDLGEVQECRGDVQRSEPAGRAQLDVPAALRAAGCRVPELAQPGPVDDGLARIQRRHELRPEVAERALVRAHARREAEARLRGKVSDELIDELLDGPRSEAEIFGPDGILTDLAKRFVERALAAELTAHVGYEPHQEPPGGTGNQRNGTTPKTLQTPHGQVTIDAPRDRAGSFEPQLVRKGQRRLTGLDEQIVGLYARGMTTREIEAHLADIYGTSVGRDTISRVTAAVLADAQEWQERPLDAVYAVLYLDALIVKVRDGKAVRNIACYLAMGVNLDGERDILGMWFQETEGAKFWLGVLTELKRRGVEDVLVCCVDGLTGFPDAIEAVYPHAWVQTCVVHLIRSSMRYVSYRDRRAVCADLKKIYTAQDRDAAERELERFAAKWDARYPMLSAAWIDRWEHVVTFLAFPDDVRRIIYTTNPIEAANRQIRKHVKTRGSFPSEDAARKLIYPSIIGAQRHWRRVYNWSAALAAFRIHFGDRVPNTAI